MYATVGADERRQRVCVGRLELVEFAELYEEARQLVSLRKLFEDGAVCGDLTRRGLAPCADVQLFEYLADLLRRVYLELTTGLFVNLRGQLLKLRAEERGQLSEHRRVNAQARALDAVEQRRDWDFDLVVDGFEALFEHATVQNVGDLRGEVGGFRRAPVLRRPAFAGCFGPAFRADGFAREVAEVVATAHGVEQVRGEQRIVRYAFGLDTDV